MRRYWHVAKGDGKIIEKIRKRVNCAVNNFIKNEGYYAHTILSISNWEALRIWRRNKYFQGNLQIVQIYVISYVR
jgi:hypothetical protein